MYHTKLMAYLYQFDQTYLSEEDSDYVDMSDSDNDDDDDDTSSVESLVDSDEEIDTFTVEESDQPFTIPTHIRIKKSWLYGRPVRNRRPPVRYPL